MFTTKEVADDFKVSIKTVQWWCRERRGLEKTGRDYLMSPEDVAAFQFRRKQPEGVQDIEVLRELTGRSLPTVYKVARKLGVLKRSGVFKFKDSEWEEAIELLRRKNDND
jgi:hypothetical protein